VSVRPTCGGRGSLAGEGLADPERNAPKEAVVIDVAKFSRDRTQTLQTRTETEIKQSQDHNSRLETLGLKTDTETIIIIIIIIIVPASLNAYTALQLCFDHGLLLFR